MYMYHGVCVSVLFGVHEWYFCSEHDRMIFIQSSANVWWTYNYDKSDNVMTLQNTWNVYITMT